MPKQRYTLKKEDEKHASCDAIKSYCKDANTICLGIAQFDQEQQALTNAIVYHMTLSTAELLIEKLLLTADAYRKKFGKGFETIFHSDTAEEASDNDEEDAT